jgi:hypothetical protein
VIGRLWAASPPPLKEILKLDQEERAFLLYWIQQQERDRALTMGQLLGVSYTVGELRSWKEKKEADTVNLPDDYRITLPLTLLLKPELREGLIKTFVSGMSLPPEYRKGEHEVVVDLSKVTTEEFKAFFKNKQMPKTSLEV